MIKKYKYFIKENNVGMGSLYHTQYPYQYNTIDNPSDRGKEGNIEYHKTVNRFQSIQNEIKNLIEKNLRKKDNNITELDVENELKKFLNITDDKKQEIREISDNCNDIKKCAKEIYLKYKKYSDINNYDDNNEMSENINWDFFDEDEYKEDLSDLFKNDRVLDVRNLNNIELNLFIKFLNDNDIRWASGSEVKDKYGKTYIRNRNLPIRFTSRLKKIEGVRNDFIIFTGNEPNITLKELLNI